MTENNITLPEIAEMLLASETVILLSHTSPDGDTVGSATALADSLTALGKRVHLLCDSPIPEWIAFICGKEYETETDEHGLVVALDVASRQMLGKLEPVYGDITDICIDHHATGDRFAKYNYCVPHAAAACEIICELLGLLGPITPHAADALYTGISTDSGGFRYSCTTPHTLRMAADLIEAGADAEDINERLYENISLDSLRAECLFLDNMETYHDGELLLVPVTLDQRNAAGLDDSQLEGFSSLARKIKGTRLGISLREKEHGVYKVSMRSNKTVDSAALCAKLGGGGHSRAAGATVHAENIEIAKSLLLDAVLPEFTGNTDNIEADNNEKEGKA